MDICGLIPEYRKNSCYTSEVNRESRSDTISVGSPWYFQISFANVTTRSAAVFPFFLRGMKCAIFVKRSMTTHNWTCSSDRGNSIMKSIATDCHGA